MSFGGKNYFIQLIIHGTATHENRLNLIFFLKVPTFKVRTYCKMDLRFWPFDEQSCEIKMGSWTFSAYAINLLIETSNTVDFSHYQGTEWEIISGTAERHETIYPCCPEPYTDISK